MSKILRWLGHPRAPRFVVAFALVLAMPSLAVGFFGDDYAFIDWLEHRTPFSPPWWDLYNFTPGDPDAMRQSLATWLLPWWTASTLHLHLVRPLSGALLALDHTLFGRAALGVTAHVRFRADGWRPGRLLGPLALVVGLLASEAALGGLAFAIAYDLVGPERGIGRDRAVRVFPLVSLALAYLAVYALVGGGTRGSGAYVTPMEPAAFLATAAVRLPVLLGDAVLGIPAEVATLGFASKLAVTGAIATVLFGLLWRASLRTVPEAERATSTWLAVGAFAALAAGVGGLPGARVLFVANLGFAPIMAIVLRHAFASGPLAVPRRAGAGLLAFVHVAFAPLSQLANQHSMQTIASATEATARTMRDEVGGRSRTFLIAASDPMVGLYAAAIETSEASETATSVGCRGWLSAVERT
jgi:hypothetical protein